LYLIFLMHLFDHIYLKITASVHLAEVAREYFTDAQMRIIGHVKLDFAFLNQLFLGRVFRQDIGIPWFLKANAGDQNFFSVWF
jgi:hypothetical protein